jgi:hypothetical protein
MNGARAVCALALATWIATGVMLGGCREADTDATSIFAGEGIATWTVERRWSIGGGDPRDAYVLSGVRGVAFVDEGVVVADAGSGEVRLFSASTGDFRWRTGGRGAGPGEFQRISGIAAVDDSTVAVWDHELQRLTLVAADGRVLETTAPRLGETWDSFPMFAGALRGGRLIFRDPAPTRALMHEPLGERRDSIRFIVTEGLEGGMRAVVTVRGPEAYLWRGESAEITSWGTLSPIFGRSTFQTVADDALVIAFSDSLEIKRFGDDGTLRTHVAHPRTAAAVSDSEIAAERARLLEERRALEERRSQGPAFLLEGRSPEELSGAAVRAAIRRLPHRPTRPALSEIRGDVLGRVWVAEHPQAGADVRRWLVLDPSLQPLGHIALPADLEVLAIGPDGLVGLERNELDVETLVFFAVGAELEGA